MPRYVYRCRACGATFEISRPMTESSAPVVCPEGHDDTVKLLSTVALTGRAGASEAPPPHRERIVEELVFVIDEISS